MAELGMVPHGLIRRKSQSTAQIYIDELMEEYTCPICFDEIDKCMMTPCGHNFCAKCIDECLNRKHICPFCSHECTQDKLIRNVHFDSVLSKLIKARTAASQQLISNLMQKTIQESMKNAPKITRKSPIAEIFTKYTSETLIKYENYYQEMLRDNNKNELKLQDKLINKLAILIPAIQMMQNNIKKHYEKGDDDIKMNDNNNDMQIEGGDNALNTKICELFSNIFYVDFIDLKKTITIFSAFIKTKSAELSVSESDFNEIESYLSAFYAEHQLLEKRVSKSCKLLFDSYEEYMKKTGPSPFLLPVSVTIRLKQRPQFWDLKLNMTDHIGVVLHIIKQKFLDLGDPIDRFEGNEIEIGLLRPFAARNEDKPLEIIKNMEVCLSELNMRHSTQIHVLTGFVLKSETPRPCFTYNYAKEKNEKCDYYRCKTCRFNWVCGPCMRQCHKGHELVAFMMDHIPSYACCYCVKKKKCKILNIKSRKK